MLSPSGSKLSPPDRYSDPPRVGATGDGLDLNHPNYFFDFVRSVRAGIASQPKSLITGQGRRVKGIADFKARDISQIHRTNQLLAAFDVRCIIVAE